MHQMDWFMSVLRGYVGRFSPTGQVPVYVWVERSMESTHAFDLQEQIMEEGMAGYVRVMRGTGPKRKKRYTRMGVVKTHPRTKVMTRLMRSMIGQNKFKISKDFKTQRPVRTLTELKEQYGNYILNDKGVLTGKKTSSGKAQDDKLIAVMWALWGAVQSQCTTSPFYYQLAWTLRDVRDEMARYAGLE